MKLSKRQYSYYASAFKTVAEGIILGSSATFFLPEVFQLKESIEFPRYAFNGWYNGKEG
jgi:hypothetical protein